MKKINAKNPYEIFFSIPLIAIPLMQCNYSLAQGSRTIISTIKDVKILSLITNVMINGRVTNICKKYVLAVSKGNIVQVHFLCLIPKQRSL